MKNRIKFDKHPNLRGKDRLPFEKINAKLITLGWDSTIEYDVVWGWYILACKNDPSWGSMLRRIKPFKIIKHDELLASLRLQQKLKSNLIEVVPFKTYKGIRTFFPEITDDIDFMSEAKFQLFHKFFRNLDNSLNIVDEIEANKNDDV